MPPTILTSTLSPSAALTRFLSATYPLLTFPNLGLVTDLLLFQNTFDVDPSNPYYHIFAGGPPIQITDDNGVQIFAAFRTDFTFLNGGMVVSNQSLWWGSGSTLDGAPVIGNDFPSAAIPSTVLAPSMYYGPSCIYVNDSISGSCPFIVPGNTATGAQTQWSCLANTVRVATTILITQLLTVQQRDLYSTTPFAGPFEVTGAGVYLPGATGNACGGTLFHGVIQQPWGTS